MTTADDLLREVYQQAGNEAPAVRRQALTPDLRDRIRRHLAPPDAVVAAAEEIILELDNYARGISKEEYGLPTWNQERMTAMTQKVVAILSRGAKP
jgi:hypothetical protein